MPLDDQVTELVERAFRAGHAAAPASADSYVDLTAMWSPPGAATPPAGLGAGGRRTSVDDLDSYDAAAADSEEMTWWRRSNMPAHAFFGLRRLDEDAYWAAARPRRLVRRSAPDAAPARADARAGRSGAHAADAADDGSAGIFSGPLRWLMGGH